MNKLCQFGPIKVLFNDIPCDSLWPFWRWKLDPFCIKDGAADIVVKYSGEPVIAEGMPAWEEQSRCVSRQLFIKTDGKMLWQQTEIPSGVLQLQLTVSADWREITINCDNSPTSGVGAFEALTFLIFYAFLFKKVLTFHGALVEEGERGFLICGLSGVGKTTHARLWRDCKNALILNGDRASCYQKDGKWYGFGTPWCGTSGEYLNRSVPLQAVVVLKRGTENRVSKITGVSLLAHIVYPGWDKSATETMLPLLEDFLESVTVLELECTSDVSSVEELYQALENLPL